MDLHSRNEESVDRVYSVEDVTRYLMFARQFKPKVFLRWYTLTMWNANRTFCGNFRTQIDYLTNYILRNALFLLQISIINYRNINVHSILKNDFRKTKDYKVLWSLMCFGVVFLDKS